MLSDFFCEELSSGRLLKSAELVLDIFRFASLLLYNFCYVCRLVDLNIYFKVQMTIFSKKFGMGAYLNQISWNIITPGLCFFMTSLDK